MSEISSSTLNEFEGSDKALFYSRQILGTDVLQGLLAFVKASETHDPGNSVFDELTMRVFHSAALWMDVYKLEALEMRIKGEQFFINEQRIRPKPNTIRKLKRLVRLFRDRGLTGLTIPRSPEREQLKLFLFQLAKAKPDGSTSDLIRSHGLTGFELNRLAWDPNGDTSASTSMGDMLFDQMFKFARDLFKNLQEDRELNQTYSLEQLLYELHHLSDEDFAGTFCRKLMEPTESPMATAGAIAAWILHGWGKTLGLPPFVNVELSTCGLLYPIASIEKISDDRASTVMHHLNRIKKSVPHTSLQALTLMEFTLSFGDRGVYNAGKYQAYQHIFSRMLRIVAPFAQMVTPDRRRPSLSPGEAIHKLLSDEMNCDRSLAKLFAAWIGLSPMGSFVKMATGEVGMICSVNNDFRSPERPQVMILKGREGETLEKPQLIDLKELREKLGTYKYSVKEEIPTKADVGLAPDEIKALLAQMNFSG